MANIPNPKTQYTPESSYVTGQIYSITGGMPTA